MSHEAIFVGIDVAMAKRKRIPIAFLIANGDRLSPLPARRHSATRHLRPPSGMGNAALVRDPHEGADGFADQVAGFIRAVAAALEIPIGSIAIDAPADYRSSAAKLRCAEAALAEEGVSFYKTPSRCEFDKYLVAANEHLGRGGEVSNLPYANLFWMLAGFALFRRLPQHFRDVRVLEVYPQATFRVLGAAAAHKSSTPGFAAQLEALSAGLRLDREQLADDLRSFAHGKQHDILDALSAAWVAALPSSERRLLGADLKDGIWVPRMIATSPV